MNLTVTRAFVEKDEGLDSLDFEFEENSSRPGWIRIKDPDFSARFISIKTKENSEILYKRFTGGFYYPVDLRLSPEAETRFYDAFAPFYDTYAGKNSRFMAQFVLDRMQEAGVPKEAKILDVGAGTGVFATLAVEREFTNLTLLDIHESMLDEAKKKQALRSATFITGDAAQIQIAHKYDAFVSIMMFDSLDDAALDKMLNNLMQYLKPGALIFIVEDKYRAVYQQYFQVLEKGLFDVSGESVFQKFYIIGKAA